jgi:hypothetical protein
MHVGRGEGTSNVQRPTSKWRRDAELNRRGAKNAEKKEFNHKERREHKEGRDTGGKDEG